MTDHEQLETLLRSSLSERAGDVDTTPALYERVQRQATRAAWLRRGVALAGAAAAVVVAVAVIPPLLPAGPLEPDIADTPDATEPTEAPSEPEPSPGTVFPDPLVEANLAFADATGTILVAHNAATSPVPVVSLAVSPFWTEADGMVAAGLGDGRIGIMDQAADGIGSFDLLIDASANGGGVGFSPDGQAVTWIEGTDLHVLPLATAPDGERVLPLQGDVPDGLVFEQWFYGADAQLVLASDPAGGVWRIPMDDSDAFKSEPTEPASLLPAAADADAVDAALLPDLSLAVLRVPADGTPPTLTLAGLPVEVDEVVDVTTELSVTGSSLTLLDPTTGTGSRRDADADSIDLVATWDTPGVVAVAPLPTDRTAPTDSSESLPLELGLQPLPLVGTRGTDLLVVDATSGTETVVPVYGGETEATLGLLDVRPGSTGDDAVVAYENFSEGETSIRFLALRDGEVELLDGLVVADAPLTGLVWSPDAMHVLWTTEAGTVGVADVTTADGTTSTSGLDELSGEGLAATDWTWDTTDSDGAAQGQLWFSTGQGAEGATELVTVTRSEGSGVAVDVDEREMLRGVAASPTDGADVSLVDFEGRLELLLELDDGRTQYLPLPALLQDTPGTWTGLAMEATGGSVVVWTEAGSSFEVRLTGEGEVRNLPDATAWTPIG